MRPVARPPLRRRSLICLAALGMVGGGAACADAPPDLARYDCTRTDDGKTVAGDALAAQGFAISSQVRFGGVNLMLIEPKSRVRANCFLRVPEKP